MSRWNVVGDALVNPRLGVELGVKEGRFTAYMLRTFPDIHMVAVDLWQVRPGVDQPFGFETYSNWDFGDIRTRFNRAIEGWENRCTVHNMDTQEAAALYDDAIFDFVFIDAEHTYEGVRDDIAAWRSKVKPGGLLCGHDYDENFVGVRKAVDELGKITLGENAVWMLRC